MSDRPYPGDMPYPDDEPPEEDNPTADKLRDALGNAYIKYRKIDQALETEKAARQAAEAKIQAAADDQSRREQQLIEQMLEQMALIIGEETTQRIVAIVHHPDLSGEEKRRLIVHLDRASKASTPRNGRILQVQPAAVRAYKFWKELRAELKRDES